MRIICDNQEEVEQLMETSKYLHDFIITVTNMSGKTFVEDEGNVIKLNLAGDDCSFGLDNMNNIVNTLQNLYLNGDLVTIDDKNNKLYEEKVC